MLKPCTLFLFKQGKVLSSVSRDQGTKSIPEISRRGNVESKPYEEIPGPRSYPVIGSLPYIIANSHHTPLKFQRTLDKDYGDIIKVTVPVFGDLIFILDVADQRKLLSLDGPIPYLLGIDVFKELRSNELANYFKETKGLISQGKEWQAFRQTVQQDLMRPRSALYYIDDIDNLAATLVDKIGTEKNGDTSNLQNILKEYALEAINVIFLGKKLGVLEGNVEGAALLENLAIFLEEGMNSFIFPKKIFGYPFPWHKRRVKANKELLKISLKNCKEAVDELDIDNDESVLAKLVRKCGKDSMIPTIMAADALFAGIDATSLTLNSLLYHLASNEEAQDKLYEEILEHIGSDGRMTEAGLQKMQYLKACQKESQRLLPVNEGTARKTQVEMELGGYKIPVGTNVIRCGIFTANDEKHFHEPDMFLPERWIRGCPTRNKADSFAHIPFGHGPRSCIGQRFANMEIQVATAKIIRKYRLKSTGEDFDLEKVNLFLSPSKPILFDIVERN